MKHGSLFSGIGGFDLAAEWMGWENIFSCEINEFGRKILEYYWPNATHYEDITTTDFSVWRGRIDILTGGFPCQPFSQAGKRKGTEDDRHLWPRMLEVIREIRPRYVVGENVYGIVNWDGGLVFEQVQADLEAEGYQVQPVVLPACAVNTNHRRDRTWFVSRVLSNSGSDGCFKHKKPTKNIELFRNRYAQYEFSSFPRGGFTTRESHRKRRESIAELRSRNDGISYRLDGITFSKWRKESIKAYGNAIVPQVAYEIFKVIQQYEECVYGGID